MSLGSDLKAARTSRKIGLEEISKKTKIPPKYLEAIEENRFEIFSSHTYAKGFIRAYAKIVGLDPQVLTRQFNAEVAPVEMRIEPKNAEAELEKALGWRPTLDRPPAFRREESPDLGLEMVEEEPEPNRHEASILRRRAQALRSVQWRKWAGQGALVLAACLLLAGLALLGRKAFSGLRGAFSHAAAAAMSGPAHGIVPDKNLHLILKGLDRSWVLVTMDDGQTSSELDLDEGEVKAYQATRNFKLKIGNAGGVEVQLNGKPLGILGALGQVVEIELPGDRVMMDKDNS